MEPPEPPPPPPPTQTTPTDETYKLLRLNLIVAEILVTVLLIK